MVVGRRIVAGLEDIKAVSFECIKCGARLTYAPGSVPEPPMWCKCGQMWRPEERRHPDIHQSACLDFVQALVSIRSVSREQTGIVGFRILFEFEEPTE
jgi:hypothetical protein